MGIRKSPKETAARREEVKGFMETLGPYSVPIKLLAEKHEVSIQVIYNDIKFLINQINLKSMDLEGKKLISSLMKNMSITEELKNTGTPLERMRAIQASNQTADTLTKIMENYGFKEKIADKQSIELEASLSTFTKEEKLEQIKRLLEK